MSHVDTARPPGADQPLLSVVIPTRNREETLLHAVANVLSAGGEEVEVVVHDTGDSDAARRTLEERFPDDGRLRYAYTTPPVSFAATFDRAVSLASGRYVTIIGDDDGILPSLIESVRAMASNGWDAMTATLPASYNWPDFRHLYYGSADAGRLSMRSFSGTVQRLDPRRELQRAASLGFQSFERLPRIYYGVVRRTCLDRLREAAGACFFGSSPDISGAVGLAQVVETLVLVDEPVFLPGSSARSGAGMSGMKQHHGSLSETPQTAAFAATWPVEVPPVYAVQTVWAQAALATLDRLDRYSTRARLDVGKLHAQTLVHNPQYRQAVAASLRANLANRGRLGGLILLGAFVRGVLVETAVRARGLGYRLTKRGYYRYAFTRRGLDTIEDAVRALEEHLAGRAEGAAAPDGLRA